MLAAALDSWVKVAEYPEYEYETLRPSSLECDDDKNYEGSDICSLCEYVVIRCSNLMIDKEAR